MKEDNKHAIKKEVKVINLNEAKKETPKVDYTALVLKYTKSF